MGRRLRAEVLEDARLLAEHHIAGVRYTRSGRRISHVLHPAFGWLTVQDYYGLQKLHDFLPLVREFIEGGYRLKLALANVEVLGTDLPLGGLLYAFALGRGTILLRSENPDDRMRGALYYAGVFLPFGEILLLNVAFDEVLGPLVTFGGSVVDFFRRLVELLPSPIAPRIL